MGDVNISVALQD